MLVVVAITVVVVVIVVVKVVVGCSDGAGIIKTTIIQQVIHNTHY